MPALSHGHQLIYSSFYNRWNFLGFKILWINSWCYCLPTKIIPPPCTQGFSASRAKPAPFTVLSAILDAKVRKKMERNALWVKILRKTRDIQKNVYLCGANLRIEWTMEIKLNDYHRKVNAEMRAKVVYRQKHPQSRKESLRRLRILREQRLANLSNW